ncbi:NitT/TauT family transport system substrate-binding protein [Enhydrobacter aerosaccus]|uniref:NitT/TauT family transport system substrate-binding protein n=1 Tax=Enhydrobacter aerosaccus TaxID=225324 RepID=A0A1T4QDR5_9HYPH|nr:ABC transporter substrate-binding protein [Enhydrobacter aerosaccus]SKA01388.1 NitT/TauT family transport system substrate-binding protein [Enhydrobacter aerosaccus]
MAIILSENFRALFYAPFYAAEATGAFKAAGVEVVLKPSPEPGAAVAALKSGEVDVMWGGPLRVMLSHQADPACDLVCFCDVVARDPFFVIGNRPRPDFSLTDLATIRFATVSEVPTPWICLQQDIRRAGLDPDTLERVTDRSMAENEAALAAGTIEAVQLFQPYAERLIRSGAGHVWYAAANRGRTAYTTLVTRRGVLEDRADEIARMVQAFHRTLGWFAGAPALEIARTLSRYFPELAVPLFAQCIERYRDLKLWATDPVVRREGYDRLHTAMRSAGALTRDIPFEAVVDTSVAEATVRNMQHERS